MKERSLSGEAWHRTRRSQTIMLDGHSYEVSPQQKVVLVKLRDALPGQVISGESIALALWGGTDGPDDEKGTIGVLIHKCREAVGRTAVMNIWKEGWYLEVKNLKHNLEPGDDE